MPNQMPNWFMPYQNNPLNQNGFYNDPYQNKINELEQRINNLEQKLKLIENNPSNKQSYDYKTSMNMM